MLLMMMMMMWLCTLFLMPQPRLTVQKVGARLVCVSERNIEQYPIKINDPYCGFCSLFRLQTLEMLF